MKNLIPYFVIGADNVYRTKHYIVKQSIKKIEHLTEDNMLVSHDTFYLRTPHRDMLYNMYYADKKNKNGKRFPCTTYTRRYIN